MMSKVDDFLYSLRNFDRENISQETAKALAPFIADPEFTYLNVSKKSLAAASLCEWVRNIMNFYEIYYVVGPKIKLQIQKEEEVKAADQEVAEIKAKLYELEEKLSALRSQQEELRLRQEKLQNEKNACDLKINLAHRLVNGLASENKRWRVQISESQAKQVTMPGDVLLVSCIISYVGCFTKRYRSELLNNFWIPKLIQVKPEISFNESRDPLELICKEVEKAEWNNEGLPSDAVSIEDAVILLNSSRWPLMIDPQLQGIKWIKQRYGDKLVVLRLNQDGYLTRIEDCITNGYTLLIENIDESVDAVLDPLLSRALIKRGKCIKIGEKEIDYDPRFRLILQTKLANPHYKPEMQAQTTLINFTGE